MRDRTTFPLHLPSLCSHLPTPSHRRHHRFLHTPHHHHRHTFPRTFLQALTVEWTVPYVAWHSTRTSSRDMPPTVVTAREHLQRKKCWVFLEWCIVTHKSGANHEESISCENIYFVRIFLPHTAINVISKWDQNIHSQPSIGFSYFHGIWFNILIILS